MNKQIRAVLQNEFEYLKENFNVTRLALFGSVSKGTEDQQSDVDLYVEFSKMSGLRFIKMVDYLEKKLGRKCDVLTKDGLSTIRIPSVAKNIVESLIDV